MLWGFTAVYFILRNVKDILAFVSTVAFIVVGIIALVVLLNERADEQFYENLTPPTAGLSVAVATAMLSIASVFSVAVVGKLIVAKTLSVMIPTSILTGVLSEALFNVALVASGEELLKLAGYAEVKEAKLRGVKLGVKVAAVIVVGAWACYHGIQAYSNLIMIVPAFINGLILLWLLLYARSFLAPILAHGIYNSIIVLLAFLAGDYGSLPFLPAQFTFADAALILLSVVWFSLLIMPFVGRQRRSDRY